MLMHALAASFPGARQEPGVSVVSRIVNATSVTLILRRTEMEDG